MFSKPTSIEYMPKIKVIAREEASGRLKEIYEEIINKRGKLAEVHQVQSLRPESIVKHIDLYMEIMFSRSELSRPEREMMAVVVSVSNACQYCQLHHAEALLHYWKDAEKVEQLRASYQKVTLSEREKALCDFAHALTTTPSTPSAYDTQALTAVGLSDAAILDATLVVAYFNFVNRMVLALGVETNETERKGYRF